MSSSNLARIGSNGDLSSSISAAIANGATEISISVNRDVLVRRTEIEIPFVGTFSHEEYRTETDTIIIRK